MSQLFQQLYHSSNSQNCCGIIWLSGWVNPWKPWHRVDFAYLFVLCLSLTLECKLQGAYRSFSLFVHWSIPQTWNSGTHIVRTQKFVELMHVTLWKLSMYNNPFLASCKWQHRMDSGKRGNKTSTCFCNNITHQSGSHYYERKLVVFSAL